MIDVREFQTEGHRLLVESTYSPSEIARLADVGRPRVSEWRKGRSRPNDEDRRALERAIGIPVRAWDARPIVTTPTVRTPRKTPEPVPTRTPLAMPAATGPTVADVEGVNLAGLGLIGLERLAAKIGAEAHGLPPKDRVSALVSQARIIQQHESLRQKSADARAEYLASLEFRRDVQTLAAAIPGNAEELRARLARFGVELPAPPAAAARSEATPETIDELLEELRAAAEFRAVGELHLASAHVLGLALDPDAIAGQLVEQPALAPQVFALLEPADERPIRAALERRMAIRDAMALPAEARRIVAELARHLGHPDVAKTIGGDDAA